MATGCDDANDVAVVVQRDGSARLYSASRGTMLHTLCTRGAVAIQFENGTTRVYNYSGAVIRTF
ncbi:hypothetical protein [Sutterella sp.]|uniref:hypothetical protein n=1 Tax=Sutterella sp. TaxID=1981025 RepID=UPI0026DFB974|nr:hypothetical protein [Sutterella sp.]MDO5532345.1 hypothetical protein [Sutterella sp.]